MLRVQAPAVLVVTQYEPSGQVTPAQGSFWQTPARQSSPALQASAGLLQSAQTPWRQTAGSVQLTPLHRSTHDPEASSHFMPVGQLTFAQRCGMQKPLVHL